MATKSYRKYAGKILPNWGLSPEEQNSLDLLSDPTGLRNSTGLQGVEDKIGAAKQSLRDAVTPDWMPQRGDLTRNLWESLGRQSAQNAPAPPVIGMQPQLDSMVGPPVPMREDAKPYAPSMLGALIGGPRLNAYYAGKNAQTEWENNNDPQRYGYIQRQKTLADLDAQTQARLAEKQRTDIGIDAIRQEMEQRTRESQRNDANLATLGELPLQVGGVDPGQTFADPSENLRYAATHIPNATLGSPEFITELMRRNSVMMPGLNPEQQMGVQRGDESRIMAGQNLGDPLKNPLAARQQSLTGMPEIDRNRIAQEGLTETRNQNQWDRGQREREFRLRESEFNEARAKDYRTALDSYSAILPIDLARSYTLDQFAQADWARSGLKGEPKRFLNSDQTKKVDTIFESMRALTAGKGGAKIDTTTQIKNMAEAIKSLQEDYPELAQQIGGKLSMQLTAEQQAMMNDMLGTATDVKAGPTYNPHTQEPNWGPQKTEPDPGVGEVLGHMIKPAIPSIVSNAVEAVPAAVKAGQKWYAGKKEETKKARKKTS